MITWAIPGNGWIEWGSTVASTPDGSTTRFVSNGSSDSTAADSNGQTANGQLLYVPRYASTSSTETQEVAFFSTSLEEVSVTQDSVSTFAGFGSNSTTTFTEKITTQTTAMLPVGYVETTTKTNTLVTELTETENPNGFDLTVFQAVGNEVLWVHPLTPVSETFQPYPASENAYTTTRATVYPRSETISVEGKTTAITLTNPEITNEPVSFSNTANSTITVTSASGSSMPMPTFSRTFRVQTTAGGGSYQFSVDSAEMVAANILAATTTVLRVVDITTTASRSYQFGTYQAAYESTSSFTQYSTGGWGLENSFTYPTTIGPTSAITSVTVTSFSAIDGAFASPPLLLQGGFGLNAGPPIISLDASYYGASRVAFAGTETGGYYSADSTVFFQSAGIYSESGFFSNTPQSSTIFPTTVTGILGNSLNTTRYTVGWTGQSYSATSANSSTGATYSGLALAAGSAVPASTTKEIYGVFPVLRIGGHLPTGVTGVAYAQKNLVKVGIGTATVTSIINGQTTWTGNAPLTFIEPISSVVLNTSPSFEQYAQQTVWAVSAYKEDPYPPYSQPEF